MIIGAGLVVFAQSAASPALDSKIPER
jgi:hypothetical protein